MVNDFVCFVILGMYDYEGVVFFGDKLIVKCYLMSMGDEIYVIVLDG